MEETIVELIEEGLLDKDFHTAVNDYNSAVLHGIVKIASKMGISTLQSYQSSQIFEAVGISREVVARYFTNTVSRVGGIGLQEIAAMVDRNHSKAFDPLGLDIDLELDSLGAHKARAGGEDHLYNPRTIHLLQQSPAWGMAMSGLNSTRLWWMMRPAPTRCVGYWASDMPTHRSRWKRWNP